MAYHDAPVRAIVLDLDGTFLTTDKQIPAENIEVLKQAADKGILVVPATGRFYEGVYEEIRALPFIRYYITVNGSDFYDAWEDRVIRTAYLSKEQYFELAEYFETLPVLYDCVTGGQGWMKADHYEAVHRLKETQAIRELILELHKPLDDLWGFVRSAPQDVQKTQILLDDRDLRAALLKELPGRFPGLAISSAVDCNIEFNRGDATKAKSLEFLCEIGGFGMENVMCIGDGLNDVDMVRTAGLGVAMGNGVPEILQAADYVTEDCDHGGFAAAVEKFCLRN